MASLIARISKSLTGPGWRVRTLRAGALCCVLASVFATMATAQNFEDERQALARAKAQSILAEARAGRLEKIAAEQMNEAEAVKARAAAVAARIQATEADISAAESRIVIIDRLRSEQRDRLAAKQEPAMRLMAALQTLSRRPPALALVQPGSVTDLVHVRAVLAGLIPRLRARTADLRAEIDRSKILRADADRALVGLETAQNRLAEQRQGLLAVFAQRRAVADQTTGQALAEQDKAMAMGEKARDIVELLGRVSVEGEVRDRLAALPGPLIRPTGTGSNDNAPVATVQADQDSIPYRLPVIGTVVQGLGEVSSVGVRSRGLTLSVRPGAQLVAPSGGTIAFAGPFRGYGNIVIIDHGRGWSSVVTSIAALDVRVGDSVLQGSPLGRAGDEQPRVTVELRQKNIPVDITRFVG